MSPRLHGSRVVWINMRRRQASMERERSSKCLCHSLLQGHSTPQGISRRLNHPAPTRAQGHGGRRGPNDVFESGKLKLGSVHDNPVRPTGTSCRQHGKYINRTCPVRRGPRVHLFAEPNFALQANDFATPFTPAAVGFVFLINRIRNCQGRPAPLQEICPSPLCHIKANTRNSQPL